MDEREENLKAEILESQKNEEKIEANNKEEVIEKRENIDTKRKDTEQIKESQYKFKQIKTKRKSKRMLVITVLIIILLILGTLFSTIFALLNSNNTTILAGISVNGTLIEGLTEEDAIKVLNDRFDAEKKKEIILKINGETYSITPEQIEVSYNVEEAVEQAYGIGRNGNIFENNFEILYSMMETKNIELEFTYNEELLINVLEGFNAKLPNSMVDNTYSVEDDELIITRGIDGIVIDIENAKQAVINSIKNGIVDEVEIGTEFKECPEIDIEKIHSEVKSEPQNASYTTDPFEIIPHKNGLDFDIEEAKKILSEEKEEYIIKLTVTEPETLTNEIGEEAFPDLLSSFSTKYDETNIPRTKNVKLAMQKLNGVVVMPGEVFSYNKTLGKRTAEAGYEYANGFAGGKVVPMLAGGICQVSSTLYDAVLYANLNIVERYNHMFQATYVEPGKDATVVYGSLDFKFENTRSYPIMIKTKAGGGLAEIKIFGIKENLEYEVEVITEVLNYTPYSVVYEDDSSLAPGQERVSQWGLQGCKSITYRIVKLNGQQVSKEVLSTDTYSPLSKIIKRGPAKTQEPTVDTSTTPEVQEPTPEITIPQEPEKTEPEVTTPTVPETPETPAQPENSEQTQTPENSQGTENIEGTENSENTNDEDTATGPEELGENNDTENE